MSFIRNIYVRSNSLIKQYNFVKLGLTDDLQLEDIMLREYEMPRGDYIKLYEIIINKKIEDSLFKNLNIHLYKFRGKNLNYSGIFYIPNNDFFEELEMFLLKNTFKVTHLEQSQVNNVNSYCIDSLNKKRFFQEYKYKINVKEKNNVSERYIYCNDDDSDDEIERNKQQIIFAMTKLKEYYVTENQNNILNFTNYNKICNKMSSFYLNFNKNILS